MGQVVAGHDGPVELSIDIESLQFGWEVALVENGTVARTWFVDGDHFTATADVHPSNTSVYRVEVHTLDNDAALYSNPIYFVPESEADQIPAERLVAP